MKGKVRIIIFICSLILLVGSLGVIGHHYWVSHQEQKDFESLEVNGGHNVTALHKKNGDIVGWLKIGGTRIDYPVMQTPDENEYYLRRNFRKESSIAGTPFMDAGSVIGTSKNYLIFGHNIKSGTMFHDLLKYEDKAFWKKHKTFSFDMLDGHHKYKVIAAFYSQIYPVKSSQFKYYKQMSITSESEYVSYIRNVKALAEYDTGITPKWGRQLITLSTCAYQVNDGRFAVVAVKIK
jgi:Uncharacterized protein conserved in bacteria